MNSSLIRAKGWVWLWLGIAVVGWGAVGAGAAVGSRVLYETRFEPGEGFDETLTLIGQGGWVGEGSGGNGLLTGFIDGEGQHAFVGYGAPTNRAEFLNVWRPVNHVPGGTNPPVVRFSVLMMVGDSVSSTNRDDFRWSVYNVRGDRLFSVDFDNETLGIHYILDDGEVVATGWTFENEQPYRLEIVMDFPGNQWTATLGGVVLAEKLPVTTKGAVRDFGDVDAVWAIRRPGAAGDNFMVFDNYTLTAEETAVPRPPPVVRAMGVVRKGEFLVRVLGTPGVTYVLEGGPDLRTWVPLKTNAPPADGYFDHLDQSGAALRFYRAVEP